MQNLQYRLEFANRIAFMLGYLAPLMEPQKVVALVEYLSDLVDPLVLNLLEPYFCLIEGKESVPGLQALQALLSSLDSTDTLAGVGLKQVSSEKRELLIDVKPGVEDTILDTVFGKTSVAKAVGTLLNGCSNLETYVRFHTGHTLPYDLTFLPRRAVCRASVILQAAEQVLPNLDSLHFYLAQILCQAYLKLCHFDGCLEETERLLHSSNRLSSEARSYLQTYQGIALEGMGELTKAHSSFKQAESEALKIKEDSSALCFTLFELYRLGMATGDMTDLPITGGRLMQQIKQIKAPHIRCSAVSFIAIMQHQLGERNAAQENSKVAIEAAHSKRMLDIEVDVRNRRAVLLLMQGYKKEATNMLVENFPLLTLSGHALVAAETKALIYQTTPHEAPKLPEALPNNWEESLPVAHQLPTIAGVHIVAGRARQCAMVNRLEGAQQLVPAVRTCEEIRRTIPEKQLNRFMANFIEIYRLFLYLPTHKFMLPDEYTAVLRVLIELFEFTQLETDQHLTRALLQSHYSRNAQKPRGNDRISELILETVLDPDNPLIHVELAGAYLEAGNPLKAKESCIRALQVDESEASAHRLLGLLAAQNREWKKAVQHYARAIKYNPNLPSRVYLEYGESLMKSGWPQAAIEVMKPHVESVNADPLGFFLLAGCYAMLGDVQRECEYLVRFVKKADDDSLVTQARERLRALGQAHLLTEIDRNQTSAIRQKENEQSSTESPKDSNKLGALSDPSSYRPCSKCGRSVYDITSSDVVDNVLARISGTTCVKCNRFFCIYPCSLRGEESFIRLCPTCRHFLVGVLPDVY